MSLIKSKIKNINEDNWINDWTPKFIGASNYIASKQSKSSENFMIVNEQIAKLFKEVNHGNVH